jgi:hypothetical protein
MTHQIPAEAARSRRCNADYRWTLPKVMAFLHALAGCGEVAEAARAVGMSRQSAYRLRSRLAGGPFAEGFELAREAGREKRGRRPVSRWEGPGLDSLTRRKPGPGPQGDTWGGEGDGSPAQGDRSGFKATHWRPK